VRLTSLKCGVPGKGIREYTISADGPKITDSFRNYERIISGSPNRVTVNEKAELSLLLGFQDNGF